VSGGAVADEDVCVPDAPVLDNAVECPVVVVESVKGIASSVVEV
jgi:hypothetical protein